MSFQAMTWAINKEIPTVDKFVLLMIANNADYYCSDVVIDKLANRVSLSIQELNKSIDWLISNGYLTHIENYIFDGLNVVRFKLEGDQYEF